ncbi:MAG TPA: hypothetical protein VNF99_19460 [Stellaceae bacterium]|nr:hypothetical protein [Stellaceae bacterium]
MATNSQIAANRRNAAKSTGPKTERGKTMVAGNALRHGLRAEKLVTFDEADGDFRSFLEQQREAFAPADAAEEQLVERIALCAWRMRRIYRTEAEMFNAFRRTSPQFHDTEMATVFDCASATMTVVSRYEIAIDRALHRAYVMLERRQARRLGEAVPAPIAVAVSGLDSADDAGGVVAKTENFRTKPIFVVESEAGAAPPSSPTLTAG